MKNRGIFWCYPVPVIPALEPWLFATHTLYLCYPASPAWTIRCKSLIVIIIIPGFPGLAPHSACSSTRSPASHSPWVDFFPRYKRLKRAVHVSLEVSQRNTPPPPWENLKRNIRNETSSPPPLREFEKVGCRQVGQLEDFQSPLWYELLGRYSILFEQKRWKYWYSEMRWFLQGRLDNCYCFISFVIVIVKFTYIPEEGWHALVSQEPGGPEDRILAQAPGQLDRWSRWQWLRKLIIDCEWYHRHCRYDNFSTSS